MRIVIPGDPKPKKNSMKIVSHGHKKSIVQNDIYADYEEAAVMLLPASARVGIDYPVNIKCVYYRAGRYVIDLSNLISMTMDILVKGGVLRDDCRDIAAANDGSRVYWDRKHPRTEIEITPLEENYEQWRKR